MARKSAASHTTPTLTQSHFPKLPRAALLHHGQTLSAPMSAWLNQKRIPPVLLLTGISGIGKRAIAAYLGQWILCTNPQTTSEADLCLHLPCGECEVCQKVLAGNEVNFVEIHASSSEESSGSSSDSSTESGAGKASTGSLKIEQFRELKSSLGYGSHEGRYKVVLIPYADRLTPQASNSLLKVLEEPPAQWVFILTATDATLLLPTLVSRCQTLKLKPFSFEKIVELLKDKGISASQAQTCAELAQGSWNRAEQYCQPEIWEKREKVLQFIQKPLNHLQDLMDWAAEDKENFELLLDFLEQYIGSTLRKETKELDPRDLEFLVARAEQIFRARKGVHLPLNRKLLLQDLLFSWVRTGNERPSQRGVG